MKKFSILTLALVLSCLPVSVLGAEVAPDIQAIGQTLFYLVNNERAQNGLPALIRNTKLNQAAQKKAEDMMRGGYFEHSSPDGKEFFRWIDETGYLYSIAGENLAANTNLISPETIVESWMNSPTHRANLLSDKYTETGLGVVHEVFQGRETLLAVQTFGHPAQTTIGKPTIHQTPTSTPPQKLEVKSKLNSTKHELVAGVSVVASTTTPPPNLSKSNLESLSFIQKLRKLFLNFL